MVTLPPFDRYPRPPLHLNSASPHSHRFRCRFAFAPGEKALAPGEVAKSPAFEHQFGNPDTKHGQPGAEVVAEAKLRPYMPGYSGHIPATLEKIGGGAWAPTDPYGLKGPDEEKDEAGGGAKRKEGWSGK